MLEQKNPSKNIGAVVGIAEKLSLMQDSVPQIKEQKYILDKVQTNEFWEKAFILEMDVVRKALRDLIQFLPKKTQRIVYTDFADQVIEYQENTPIEMGNRLENYRKKVEFYLKEHQDKPFILCEYAHSMGNSNGALFKYIDLEKKYPLYQGGFIWDYIDQALYHDGKLCYGGDFGERPSDYDFCGNGIVFADRTNTPKIQILLSICRF